jgi:hypothetical protein
VGNQHGLDLAWIGPGRAGGYRRSGLRSGGHPAVLSNGRLFLSLIGETHPDYTPFSAPTLTLAHPVGVGGPGRGRGRGRVGWVGVSVENRDVERMVLLIRDKLLRWSRNPRDARRTEGPTGGSHQLILAHLSPLRPLLPSGSQCVCSDVRVNCRVGVLGV